MNKLLVILGPTASGKSDMAVKLALRLRSGRNDFGIKGAEIISADSRQVYKGMDIGSGKVTKKETKGVAHHLLSVANPKTRFTVSQYQKLALKAIKNIQKKGKLPILVGGTSFYIQAVVDGIVIPELKPDWKLRAKLERQPLPELAKRLQTLDPVRASTIDQNNPRRVIRALELVIKLGHPVATLQRKDAGFDTLILGIKKDPAELKKLINKRLLKRLKNNAMINEVKKLRASGLSWKRLEEFGLEYRFVAQYLQNKTSYQEMVNNIQKESEHYAKRQMTWFKREPPSPSGSGEPSKRINWIKNYSQALKVYKKFIKKEEGKPS